MRRVAVLGSNGQLGSDLKELLSFENVVPLFLTRKDIDVDSSRSILLLRKLLEEFRPDYVVNCIGYVRVDDAEDDLHNAFQVNSVFVASLAKLCHLYSATLIHISTDFVFDGQKDSAYVEEDPLSPINIYGISKAAGELAVRAYCERYFILRVSGLFGVAGARGKGGNFVETMVSLARQGREIKVVDDQYTCPTHTYDVARGVIRLIADDISEYGTYHCVSSGYISWHQLAEAIFHYLRVPVEVERTTSQQLLQRARRPQFSVLSNKKIIKYSAMPTWSEALECYLRRKGHY